MFTVIKALFLRETYTMYGTSRFGYFWALFRDVFVIMFVATMRYLTGMHFQEGLHIVFFVVCGFFVYFMVTECVAKCMRAIQANSGILSFPHVIPLDLMISRCLFSFLANIQSAVIIVFIAVLCGIDFCVTNVGLLLYCIFSTVLFGMATGIFISTIIVFYPIVEKMWIVVTRILLICSAVFIPLNVFPPKYIKILVYNPLLQIIEGMRSSISHELVVVPILNISYVNSFILIFFVLGLSLQKVSRGRLDE